MMHHANASPSASGKATAALEIAAVRLRAHHHGPGRPGGLGHPAAPARTSAPGPRRRAADGAKQASPDVHVDHHHCSPGADHHASPFHHSEPWAASRQQTDHDHRTGHGPRAGHRRWHDNHHGALRCWRHHPAHRDRAIDHGRAHHHRPNHHGRAHHHRAIDHGRVHDHAGDHDQHRTHYRADDQRRADHDRAGNNHDRTSDPARQPTSKPLGRGRRCVPAHSGSAVPAGRPSSTSRRDTRQATPRQPPPPPRLIGPAGRQPTLGSLSVSSVNPELTLRATADGGPGPTR
jgi:hypothetical protein